MRSIWQQFFWGPPSHKTIAWVGALAGLVVIALPIVIAVFGTGGHPVFLLALLLIGLAETGWGAELLPRSSVSLAGWGRAARWVCAIIGFVLAVASLLAHLAPLWFAGIATASTLLLVVEMAPSGYANRA